MQFLDDYSYDYYIRKYYAASKLQFSIFKICNRDNSVCCFSGDFRTSFSQLGNNVIIGYLASLGYWSFCQFDILTEENVLYIFPIISGEIEMGKLMILMSINSFLLVVFFLSVKETRGMYK